MTEVTREMLSPSPVPHVSSSMCILLPFDPSGASCSLYRILGGVRDAEFSSQSLQATNLLPEP